MIILTTDLMKKLYPKISDRQARAFVDKQGAMSGILASPERAALAFAHVSAETSGFNNAVVKNLTENVMYSHQGMANTWKNRFGGDPQRVIAKYGSDANWRRKAISDIYNTDPQGRPRMGNRPGSDDGWNYIGRGAPQVTGRDGYMQISQRTGHDFINNPALITTPELQPEIIQAFWDWKKLNRFADRLGGGDDQQVIEDSREVWNGGHNGLDVVQKEYVRMVRLLRSFKPETAASNVQPVSAPATIDTQLQEIQAFLISIGYFDIGDEDGRIGGKTLGGIQAFFNDRGLPIEQARYPSQLLLAEIAKVKTEIDPKTGKTWRRPIAPGRAYATETDLADKIPSIAPVQAASWWQKLTAWFGGAGIVGGGATKLVDTFTDAKDRVSPVWYMVQDFFPTMPQMIFLAVVIAVAIISIRKMNQANASTVAEYQKGRIN